MILDLQSSFEDSTVSLHIFYTQFVLSITSYISMGHLSKLINQY